MKTSNIQELKSGEGRLKVTYYFKSNTNKNINEYI